MKRVDRKSINVLGYEMENSIAEVQVLIPDFAKTDNPFEDKAANDDNGGDMGAV